MKTTRKTLRRIRVSIVVLAFVVTAVLPGPFQLTASAAVVVTAHDNTYIAGGGAQYVDPSLTLSGSGTVTSAKVYFDSNYVAYADYLSCTSENGISGVFSPSTGVLTVTGSADISYYQAFLRKVTYYNASATSGTKTIYFSVSQGTTSTYYYSGTGHFYEYVSASGITWLNAKTAAEERQITVDGTPYSGYLATITGSGENSFVAEKCAGDGWIGASDNATYNGGAGENYWYWVTGPEAGTQFWYGVSNGYSVNSKYENWHSGEPNNSDDRDPDGEDYAHMYSNDGTWNDYSGFNSGIKGYLVEYGTTSIDLTSSSIDSCTITIVNKPTNVSINTISAPSTTSISLSWSATNATGYVLYRDGSPVYSGSGTSYTDTGLGVNTAHTYYVAASNTGGTTNSSNVSKYTLAEPVSLTVTNQTTYSINNWSLTTGNNPAGTRYLVQYSTNGSTWPNVYTGTGTSGTHSGLAEDTTYYYCAFAYNGDGVPTAASSTQTVKTNDCPEITNLSPTADIYKSEVEGYTTITLSGTVTDHDNDSVTLSATMNGKTATTTVGSTSAGASWSLSWDVITDSFDEGSFTSVVISTDDGTGKTNATSSATWTNTLYVDKTAPAAPAITNNTSWTNAASVSVTIAHGADAAGTVNSGVGYTEYRYMTVDADTGETTADWTFWATYSGAFNITTAGVTTIQARTYDIVGNLGATAQSTVRIDRTSPVPVGSFTLEATYGDTVYTRSRTVNITGISALEAGAGVTEPTKMQISNSADFATYTEVAYATSYAGWTLSDTDGEKTVSIRFVDAVGNVGSSYSDTIVYDSTPPVVSISAPSRYAVKNGLSVSYQLGVDDATATIVGINSDDISEITLASSGTIAANAGEMSGWVTITDDSATTRTVTIAIPEEVTNEGTIAISVNAAAATDPAGNTSAMVPGNFSFNVDCTAPTNQNILFPDDLTVSGGTAVTLAVASADCEGGQAGDSVRFASVEDYGTAYDGTDPANGTTITSTHGRSMTMIAPTEEGTYRLYIIDEAGNVSLASTATLTVKNDGPRVTISQPSDSYVQAASTVEYTVTYSSDTDSISLSQEHVVLVRTGTANAYVTVSEIEGQLLSRKVTLSNLMGEGTVAIRIAADSAQDDIGNPAAASAVSDPVKVDNTPADLSVVSIASSNTLDTQSAKELDTITLSFTANEPLLSAVVTICGRGATVSADETNTSFTATYPIPSGTTLAEGEAKFTILATDLAGNVSDVISATTDSSSVELDFTAPAISLIGAMDSTETYYTGSVTLQFDEAEGQLENLNSGSTITVHSGDEITASGKYRLTVTDAAGNQSAKTFVLSGDYFDVQSDSNALAITYAPGDSESYVTRDVTLPLTGDAGSTITWSSNDGTVISDGGVVARPDAASGDAVVTLIATIEKNGVSTTKTFALTVIAQAPDNDLAYATEDAQSAVIFYAAGDSQTSVTQNLGLADSGVLHESVLTWESDSAYVVISAAADGESYTATVMRPAFLDGDATVHLTVTATQGGETAQHVITLIVKKQAGSEEQSAQADADAAYISYQAGDTSESVTGDITFVFASGSGSTGVWTSSDESAIQIDGDTGLVTRPGSAQTDATVTITLTVTNGASQAIRTYDLAVKALDSTPQQDALDVQSDLDALAIGYRGTDTKDSVTTHMILATNGAAGSTISWASSNPAVVASDGMVTRSSSGDVVVTLTATVTKGVSSATKTFTVTVQQMALTLLQQLGADANQATWANLSAESIGAVTADLELMNVGANGCTITWSSDDADILASDGTVTRGAADAQVTLRAVVAKQGFYIVKEFTVTVKAKN